MVAVYVQLTKTCQNFSTQADPASEKNGFEIMYISVKTDVSRQFKTK